MEIKKRDETGEINAVLRACGINTHPHGTELMLNAIDFFREAKHDVTIDDLIQLKHGVEKMIEKESKEKETKIIT